MVSLIILEVYQYIIGVLYTMKRIKHKQFKRHIDLIRYAVRRAIHRIDVVEPEKHAEQLVEHIKKTDWLQQAKQKLGRVR